MASAVKREDPWERYYRESSKKKKRNVVQLGQALIAAVLFAIVWGLGASGTDIGKECGRLVWQATTMNGDFSSLFSDIQMTWERIRHHPLVDSVKAVTARPISPLNYLVSPVEGELVVPFGTAADGTYHEEVEWEVAFGTPVKAVAAGKVLDVIRHDDSGSRSVIVQSGPMTVRYGYLSEAWITVGDLIARGQTIGRSGKKGKENPRLSLSIREKGTAIDPIPRLKMSSPKERAE